MVRRREDAVPQDEGIKPRAVLLGHAGLAGVLDCASVGYPKQFVTKLTEFFTSHSCAAPVYFSSPWGLSIARK